MACTSGSETQRARMRRSFRSRTRDATHSPFAARMTPRRPCWPAGGRRPDPARRPRQRHRDTGRRRPSPLRHRLRAEPLRPRASRRRRVDRRAREGRHRLPAVLPARRLHAVAVVGAAGRRRRARRDTDAGRARLPLRRSPNLLPIPAPAGERPGRHARVAGRHARGARCDRDREGGGPSGKSANPRQPTVFNVDRSTVPDSVWKRIALSPLCCCPKPWMRCEPVS